MEAKKAGVPFSAQSVGGMFGLYFAEHCPENFAEMMRGDLKAFNTFFHTMLDGGVYLAPAAYEAGFVSIVHSDADIAASVVAGAAAFARLKS